MKRFDDIFAGKVKDAFSNYNADHLADDAWNALTGKKKRKGIIIIPLWAKAATVAVLITAGGIITYNTFFSDNGKFNEMAVVSEQKTEPGEAAEKDIVAAEVKEVPVEKPGTRAWAEPPVTPGKHPVEERLNPETAKPVRQNADKWLPRTAGVNLINTDMLIEDLSNQGMISYYEPYTETAVKERKTELMAGLSGMVSRVDDNTDPGSSMGVYLERELSKRISVRPGIAFAYQGHNLSGSNALDESIAYTTPQSNLSSVDIENNSAQLNFLAFEIPLNLVFTVWERRRSKVYLSAGASTMVYLKQKLDGSFTNTYTVENYDSATGDVTYERNSALLDVENNYGAFSHVDLMGLANLSAGYSMPLGGKNNILFEPFVKLPVSGLTSLDLRVFYGGISFKLRFLDQK